MPLALVIVACILFILAAIPYPPIASRVSVGWLGLFFWALSTIWGRF